MPDERLNLPSASGFERLSLCRGSFNLEQQAPEPPKDASATEGTKIHYALQHGLVDDLGEEEIMYHACKRQERAAVFAAFGEIDPDAIGGLTVLREERLHIYEGDKVASSGKYDVLYGNAATDTYLIIDYKTGNQPATPAPENLQLRGLAVALHQLWKPKLIYAAIIQPKVPSNPLSITSYDQESIRYAEHEILKLLDEAMDPDAPRTAGEKQCRWCKAKSICPEAEQFALAVVPEQALLVKEGRKTVVQLPMLTGEQLADTLPKILIAETIFKAMKAEAKARLKDDPYSIPGYRLRPAIRRELEPREFIRKATLAALDPYALLEVKITDAQNAYGETVCEKKKDYRGAFDHFFEPEFKEIEPSMVKGEAEE